MFCSNLLHMHNCKNQLLLRLTFTKRSLIWRAKLSTLYNAAFEQSLIVII